MMAVQRPSLRGSGGLGPSSTCLLQCPAPKALSVCTHSHTLTSANSNTIDMDVLTYDLMSVLNVIVIYMPCPLLRTGAAIRHCDVERGWLEPDLYNCTSPPFVELNAAVCVE